MEKLELKWFTAQLSLTDWKDSLVFVLTLRECKGAFFIAKMCYKTPRRSMVMTKFELHGLS